MIATGINPYTKKALPDSFLETIKSQVNVLEFLGLKKAKDQRSVDESLKEVFDARNEIDNKYSDGIYDTFINEMSIIARVREVDVRGKLKPSDIKSIMTSFLNLAFFYFSDCKNMIRLDYTPNGLLTELTERDLSVQNFRNVPTGFTYGNLRCYKIFSEMKTIDYLRDGKFVEIFYVLIAYQFMSFMKKIMNSKSDTKVTFFDLEGLPKTIEDIVKQTFDLPP